MAEDKLLLSLHLYETDLTEIDSKMNKVVEYQNTYNIPAVITEFGVSAEEELSVRIAATQEMMNMYNSTGIPFIWWDNGKVDGYAIFDRTTGEVIRPQIVEILFGSN